MINENMSDLGKYLERTRDKAEMDWAAKSHRLAFKIKIVRERSKGAEFYLRGAINRDEAVMWTERSKDKRLQYSLEEEKVKKRRAHQKKIRIPEG